MRRVLVAITTAAAIAITTGACAPIDPLPSPRPTASSSTPPVPSATTSPPVDAPAGEVVIGVESLTVTREGATTSVDYSDGAGVVSLVMDLTGEAPPAVPEPPYNGVDFDTDSFDFTGISVFAPQDGAAGPGSISVTAQTLGGLDVRTAEGVRIGSTRESAVSVGARDGGDSDQDGTADYLDLGRVEVPDAESLSTPGTVGILFVLLVVPEDVVTEIQAPANDFSDI